MKYFLDEYEFPISMFVFVPNILNNELFLKKLWYNPKNK